MADDWLHELGSGGSRRRGPSAPPVVFADIFNFSGLDDALDLIDDAFGVPKPSKKLADVEDKLTQFGQQSLMESPNAKSLKAIGKLVVIAKVVKLVIGSDEDSGRQGAFAQFDLPQFDDPAEQTRIGRETFDAIIRAENRRRSGAGLVLIDPVWLADPKV